MALDFMSFVMGKSTNSGGAQPSGNIGYQVTFKVDDDDYYIASCQQGESISEPPIPTPQDKVFFDWRDANDNVISFPYTPNGDIELNATFKDYNYLVSQDGVICILGTHTLTWKNSTEKAICSYGNIEKSAYALAIRLNSDGTITDSASSNVGSSSLTYNGTLYYYTRRAISSMPDATDSSGLKRYKFTADSVDNAVRNTLDAYFGVTE